jgi:putative phosphoribosyl transferase
VTVIQLTPVTVDTPAAPLAGDIRRPGHPRGLVVFAHGSGSSRRSPRNVQVAETLAERGHASLLFDLLTESEEVRDRRDASLRFDIGLLAARLTAAVDWAGRQPELAALALGLFGASTGAAAALVTAAARPEVVRAVVSRGGRPDLADSALPHVTAPTLLIVGGRDEVVLGLNQQAAARMTAPLQLVVVPGATHLFEEPGALEEVARLAGDWFDRHLQQERA